MKRNVLFVLFASLAFVANTQNYLIETFKLSATGKDYGIYTDIDSGESSIYYLYYDMQAPNAEQEVQSKMSFYIGTTANSSIEVFKKELAKAKEKFVEWRTIAQSQSLKMISKRVPVRVNDQNLYFTENGKWYSETGVDMWFTFYVNKDGICYLILESDYMTSDEVVAHSSSLGFSFAGYFAGRPIMGISPTNSTVTIGRYCSGASLTFSSEEEIDAFIEKIDKVVEWKRKNVSDGKSLK